MQNDTKCYRIAYIHGMLHSSLHTNKKALPFFTSWLYLSKNKYTNVFEINIFHSKYSTNNSHRYILQLHF